MLDDELIDSAARQVAAARAAAASTGLVTARDTLTDSIPGYRVLRDVRRGGQGAVYEAVQLSTHRRVAVKVLYEPGEDASQRRRFEREIEILGQLRHPNIVTVFDSGSFAGRHFYAMDLVAGVPLDRWTGGSLKDVLQLFVSLCEAINAAHLRGVIHRDLKPGNVLVDDTGAPHVLDFGLATFTSEAAHERASTAAMTQTGQFVGTLPWASPEQTFGSTDDLDTRADVYAIGVLLYQTITGRFPYRVDSDPADVIDQIRRADPGPMNEASRPISQARPVWRVDADVETIVRMCLQKDRARRYQTAGDVARDLTRYLRGEPIAARRDSLLYVLRKHLARNRVIASAALVALLAVGIGMLVSLYYWHDSAQQRAVAERRQREADKVIELLEEMFGSRDPQRFLGPDATVRQMLDQHAAAVFTALADEPYVEARLRNAIGTAYDNLGLYDAAVAHYERAAALLRAQSPLPVADLSRVLRDLGLCHCAAGRFAEAEKVLQEARQLDVASGTQGSMVLLYLGIVSMERGNLKAAEDYYRRAIETSAHDAGATPDISISARRLLGGVLIDLGRKSEAETLVREALQAAERTYKPGDSQLAACLDAMGGLLHQMGRSAEAVPFLQRAVASERALLGDRNPRLAINLTNLGIALQAAGDLDGAERALREALDLRRSTLSPGHPDLGYSLLALGALAEKRGRMAEAESLLAEGVSIMQRSVEEHHPALVQARADLDRVRKSTSRTAPAE